MMAREEKIALLLAERISTKSRAISASVSYLFVVSGGCEGFQTLDPLINSQLL